MTSVQQTAKVGNVRAANGICSDVVCMSYTSDGLYKKPVAVVANPATGEVPHLDDKYQTWKGREFDGDIYYGNPGSGLTPAGLQKILNNQAQLSLDMRQLDAAGVMARASEAESAASASAVRAMESATKAMESATKAGSVSEVVEAAKPLLEAVQRMEARLTAIEKQGANMQTRLTAIEKQGASSCCVLM